MAIPNWAAKFFIDALLAKAAAIASLPQRPRGRWRLSGDVPTKLTVTETIRQPTRLTVVMYTSEASKKLAQMVETWSSWAFKPDCVVVEAPIATPKLVRLRDRVRDDGVRWAYRRLTKRTRPKKTKAAPRSLPGALEFCRKNGIPFIAVNSVNDPASVEEIRRFKPDMAIHAGAGILRAPILAVPKIGTINAHMGILPYYRGMNVAEWARFNDDPVGPSVHWIDSGIDTGDIVCVRPVDVTVCQSIAELRDIVDRAQLALLGEVLRLILETGLVPPRRRQAALEGIQFFRLHPELASVLELEMTHREGREA